MKCPCCNKETEIDARIISNTENYGGSLFVTTCDKCNRIIEVVTKRTVKIVSLSVSNKYSSELSF